MKKLNRFLLHSFQILFFSTLVLFSFLGYEKVQNKMDLIAEDLKTRVLVSAEDFLGYHISYDRISPSVLTYFEIRNLSLTHPETGNVLLKIRNLKIFYNPFALIFSQTGKVPISNIYLTGMYISYEETRDGALIRKIFSGNQREGHAGGGPDFSRYFSGRIRIRSVDIQYRTPAASVSFSGNSITLRQQKNYMRVKMGGSLAMAVSDIQSPLDRGAFDFVLTGSLLNNLGGFNLNGDFKDIRSNLLDMDRQRLNIRYSGGEIKLAKIRDSQPYDLSLSVDRQKIQADFSAEQFSFDNILVLKDSLAPIDPWLNTVLSGSCRVIYSRNTGSLSYDYDGTAFLRNEKLPFPVHADLDVRGDENTLYADKIAASTPSGSLSYSGVWSFREGYPLGSLSFFQIPVSPGVAAEGRLALSQVDEFFYIQSEFLSLDNGWNPGNLKLLITRNREKYIYSLRSDLNPANSYKDQIFINGELSFEKQVEITADFQISDMDLNTVTPFFPRYSGAMEGKEDFLLSSKGTVKLRGNSYSATLDQLTVSDKKGEKSLKCKGFISPEEIEIYALEAAWNRNYLLGSITGSMENGNVNLQTNWNLNNNLYLINGVYSEGKVSILGSYGLKGQFLRTPNAGFLATVESENLPLSWNDQDILASLNVRGRYESRDWEIYFSDSRFQWKNSEFLNDPSVSLTAYLAPGVINLFSVQYGDQYSILSGSGSLFYDLNQKILNGSIVLHESDNPDGNESYSVYCVYNDGNISATVDLKNALLNRFEQAEIKGRIDAELTMEGSLKEPVVEGQISADKVEFNKNMIGASAAFRLNTQKIELFDLNLKRNNVTLSKGLGFLNFQDGSLMFTTHMISHSESDGSEGNRIESGATLSLSFADAIGLDTISDLGSRDFKGRIRIHPVQWNGMTTFASKTVSLEKRENLISGYLAGKEDQFFMYDMEQRSIKTRISDPFPVRFEASGFIDPDNLDLQFRNIEADLNLVNYFMPKDEALDSRFVVFRENSQFTGNINISGTLQNPEFYGRLDSKELLVLTPYAVKDVGMTQMVIYLEDQNIRVDPFFIPIGDGGLKGSGYLNMNGWGIKDYELLVSSEKTPGTPFSYNAHGVLANGAFTGNIRLYGTDQQGGLEGRIVLNELIGSIGSRSEKREISRSNPGYPFSLDLEFVTGRSVLFLLPNPQLEIVRAAAEPGESIKLMIDTRNRTLSLNGEISIRNGEIHYFERTFRMTEGSLTFNETEEDFNPFLNLQAEIDTTDINGDDVTVFLTYRNPIRDEFSPTFRTDPPKSDDQIMALFGQSLVPYDTDQVDLATLVLATGGMVSNMGFTDPFENALKESLNLDSVTIETDILENALLDQLSGYDNYSGTESAYNLGRYLDNTSIYLGQFLGDYLFFSAGLLVDYNELDGINSYTGGMSLVPDLTLEMRTPFFLVSWNYNQDNAPEFNTDFVPRNAISLEWRYSY